MYIVYRFIEVCIVMEEHPREYYREIISGNDGKETNHLDVI